MSTDALIYDAVRTPRGKGKSSGALHEVSPIDLVVTVLEAVRERSDLDTSLVEDVVLGCVEPVKDQGSNIARVGALAAGYDERVAGVQINRFCASGLEAFNMAAAQVMAGQAEMSIGGGVESMSRVPMQSSGGAWFADPRVSLPTFFVPQGISADLIATKWGYSRHDLDSYAIESQRRAAHAWEEGYFKALGHPRARSQRADDPRSRRDHAPRHKRRGPVAPQALLRGPRHHGRLR